MAEPDGTDLVALRRRQGYDAWVRTLAALAGDDELNARVDAAGRAIVEALRADRKVLLAGNGGSSAIASHLAAELVGRCIHDRRSLPALSLGESAVAMSAVANDYGFGEIFARGVRGLGSAGDVLVVMSTSGSSANVHRALEAAREMSLLTVALTGSGGESFAHSADIGLVAPTGETPRVQEVHLLWGHLWCEAVDLLWQQPAVKARRPGDVAG